MILAQATILGPPRTKKAHNQLVHIPGKRTESYGRCEKCGQEVGRGRGFDKVLPSKQFQEWMTAACLQGPSIRHAIQKNGVQLPLREFVAMKCLFFRDRNSGDLTGLLQAVFDGIQAPMYSYACGPCKKKTLSPSHTGTRCTECDRALHIGKQSREGMGIILDDSQIKSTDGSRLYVDSARPRVEITISTFEEEPMQVSMFQPEEIAAPEPPAPKRQAGVFKVPSRGLLTPEDEDF